MKRPLTFLGWAASLALAIVPPITFAQEAGEGKAARRLEEAKRHFHDGKEVIQARYRKEMAEVIAAGDRVEVYLLDSAALQPSEEDPFVPSVREDEFPILPYNSKTKILKKATLTPEQRKEFLPALQKVVGAEKDSGGAMCHFPIHGVRVFSGDELVFQTSFCWHCGNYYLHYPDGAGWVGLSDTADLTKAFEKMMPIPQSEIDRFNAKYGPDRNKGKTKEEEKKEGR